MCEIAGFCKLQADYTRESGKWKLVLTSMSKALLNKPPEDKGELLAPAVGLAYAASSTINPGYQPITRDKFGCSYSILHKGEFSNTIELRENLMRMGYLFKTRSDTEVILIGYMAFGIDYIKELKGSFALAIWDDNSNTLLLARDPSGIEPLFYTIKDHTLIFATRIEAILQHPYLSCNDNSNKKLVDFFDLYPTELNDRRTPIGIYSLPQGNILIFNNNMLHSKSCLQVESVSL